MKATGGDLKLQGTSLNKGTTFVLEFPFTQKSRSPSSEKSLKEEDILFVDDDQDWITLFKDNIQEEGYSLYFASSFSEALKILKAVHFKLAVFDIRLLDSEPDNKDGLQLLKYIENNCEGTKVIIITGYWTEQDEQTARKSSHLIKFIRKETFDVLAFKSLVQQTLKG
jgi:DNA-binding NtrC family response regulator